MVCHNLGKYYHLPLLQFIQLYDEYLARDIGGYLCKKNHCAFIAARLNASQRSRDCVPLNRSPNE